MNTAICSAVAIAMRWGRAACEGRSYTIRIVLSFATMRELFHTRLAYTRLGPNTTACVGIGNHVTINHKIWVEIPTQHIKVNVVGNCFRPNLYS